MLLAFALYPYFYCSLAPDGADIAATVVMTTVQEESLAYACKRYSTALRFLM